jgi:hypothetical protein
MTKTERLFLLLHEAGWSMLDTDCACVDGITWLVYGTKGVFSIQANGSSSEGAWKQATRVVQNPP